VICESRKKKRHFSMPEIQAPDHPALGTRHRD
jgi:hypothetical protein